MKDDKEKLEEELVILARYAVQKKEADIRLYLAQLIRKYRDTKKNLAQQLLSLLESKPDYRNGALRYFSQGQSVSESSINYESRPPSLKGPLEYRYSGNPILQENLKIQLNRIITEHRNSQVLRDVGLNPSSTLAFVGSNGMGKTMTAHWIAKELKLPLYTVDLATVVSSYLGQTGSNLKDILEYVKLTPSVLLLDEMDSLAKTRGDNTDVGELKRIVTVLLQEIENWPPSNILIAATNHPEIIDEAMWRRFDHVLKFERPIPENITKSVQLFFMEDWKHFKEYEAVITLMFKDKSFAEIENSILNFRRMFVLDDNTAEQIVTDAIREIEDRKSRLMIARALLASSTMSHYRINQITGVSRDTLRKYKMEME